MVNFKSLSLAILSAIAFAAPSFAQSVGSSTNFMADGCNYDDLVADNGVVTNVPGGLIPSPNFLFHIRDDLGRGFEEDTTYQYSYAYEIDFAQFLGLNPDLALCFDTTASTAVFRVSVIPLLEDNVFLTSEGTTDYATSLDMILLGGGIFPFNNTFDVHTQLLPPGVLAEELELQLSIQVEVVELQLVPLLPIDGNYLPNLGG